MKNKIAIALLLSTAALATSAHAVDEHQRELIKNELTASIPAFGVFALEELTNSLSGATAQAQWAHFAPTRSMRADKAHISNAETSCC
jgi:hypothetical protein